MTTVSLKKFASIVKRLPTRLNDAANDAMYDAAKDSVKEVKKQLREAETSEGSYPLVNTRQMLLSTRGKKVSRARRGRRISAEVGVYTNYAAAMEYGAGPHTPPLDRLIEWARYKKSKLQRRTNAGKANGAKMNAKATASRKSSGLKQRPKLSKKGEQAARSLAVYVQKKIAGKIRGKKGGLRPRFYMSKSQPKIRKNVVKHMKKRMRKLGKIYPIRVTVRRVS